MVKASSHFIVLYSVLYITAPAFQTANLSKMYCRVFWYGIPVLFANRFSLQLHTETLLLRFSVLALLYTCTQLSLHCSCSPSSRVQLSLHYTFAHVPSIAFPTLILFPQLPSLAFTTLYLALKLPYKASTFSWIFAPSASFWAIATLCPQLSFIYSLR